jgi:hypothetical protein
MRSYGLCNRGALLSGIDVFTGRLTGIDFPNFLRWSLKIGKWIRSNSAQRKELNMSQKKRKQHSANFEAKVALAALRNEMTIS